MSAPLVYVVLTDGPAGVLVAGVFRTPPDEALLWEIHTGETTRPAWDTVSKETRDTDGRLIMLDARDEGGPVAWVTETPLA